MKKIMLVILSLVLGLAFFPIIHSFADDLTQQGFETVERDIAMEYNVPTPTDATYGYYYMWTEEDVTGEVVLTEKSVTLVNEGDHIITMNSTGPIQVVPDLLAYDDLRDEDFEYRMTIHSDSIFNYPYRSSSFSTVVYWILFVDETGQVVNPGTGSGGDIGYSSNELPAITNPINIDMDLTESGATVLAATIQEFVDDYGATHFYLTEYFHSSSAIADKSTNNNVSDLTIQAETYQTDGAFYNTTTGTLITLLPVLFIILLVGSAVIFIPRN